MRVLASVFLLLLFPILMVGIVFVGRHDGDPVGVTVTVFLPAAGITWCLIQLMPRPGGPAAPAGRPDHPVR
jgi:hypothetical protein